MSESFDPYRVWLGIPPESRPPTHFELLGISPNEDERAVIEAAVLRQSGYVRNFQIGKYAKDASRVLNEIAAAKACLLDSAKRAEYDAELQASRAPVTPAAHQAPPRAVQTTTTTEVDLDMLVATVAPASEDLLKRSTRAVRPTARTSTNRRHAPRLLRAGTMSRRSLFSWQTMAGFAIGVAFTLATVALWPRRAEKTSRGTESPSLLTSSFYHETAPTTSASERSSQQEPSSVPLEPAAAHAQSEREAPQVVRTRTQTYDWLDNIAREEDGSFYVRLTGDHGWSGVGYELERAHRVAIELKVMRALRRMNDDFFAGFLVDYHRPAGYSKRVALSIGPFSDKSGWDWPVWGKHTRPDEFVDLSPMFAFNERKYLEDYPDIAAAVTNGTWISGQEHWQRAGRHEGRHAAFRTTEVQELDLQEWAPRDWDGNAWFSVAISNAGAGALIEGELIEPAPPSVERLPGEFRRLTGHTDSVMSLAFLPDGRLLSGSFDTTWAVWETHNGIGMRRWTADRCHEGPVRAVAVASDNALISNGDRILRVDVKTGQVLQRVDLHTESVRAISSVLP